MKALENSAKIAQIQSRLNKYAYLSKTSLPGYADGRVFQHLQSVKKFPDRNTNPNFYHWYILIKQFSPSTIAKWVTDQLYFDQEDTLIGDFTKVHNKKEQAEIAEEARPRADNINEFEYTVDIYVKDWMQEKIKKLQEILEEYRATIEFEEGEKSKFIRVICRMEAARNQEMVNRISADIEYGNIEIKKRSMKGNLSTTMQKGPTQS